MAAAQSSLGDLIDAGAKPLSGDDFRQQVAQHTLVGTFPSGREVEVIYAESGVIQGRSVEAAGGTQVSPIIAPVDGVWNVDERGRVCTSMVIGRVMLPLRCQYWFKFGDAYYISDSDSDRSAKLLRRIMK
jgi:hypothetical protein